MPPHAVFALEEVQVKWRVIDLMIAILLPGFRSNPDGLLRQGDLDCVGRRLLAFLAALETTSRANAWVQGTLAFASCREPECLAIAERDAHCS